MAEERRLKNEREDGKERERERERKA